MLSDLRLLIVDGHQLFRECLSSALRAAAGGREVEVADSAEQALQKLAFRPPDVLLVGIDANGGARGAVALTREVAARYPQVRVVLLGSEQVQPEIVACLEAGARGYVYREQSLDELEAAIARVARGEAVVPPALTHLLFARLGELGLERRRRERLEFLDLTPRELEILRLIAEGMSNQRIAERLYLSVHTVKNHVHNMLERLGLGSRGEAVQYARKRGWLREPCGVEQVHD